MLFFSLVVLVLTQESTRGYSPDFEAAKSAVSSKRSRRRKVCSSLEKNSMNEVRRRLAELSLEDLRWRREAERATDYIKPEGDADAIRVFERYQKLWSAVVDEEEYRAEQIVSAGGKAVRPMNAPPDARGPLGNFEERLVQLFTDASLLPTILRSFRQAISQEVNNTIQSERYRASQSTTTKMRPLDAPPSILGRLEAFFDDVYREEYHRTKSGQRPMEQIAKYRGPLAKLEYKTTALLDVVVEYEQKRYEALNSAGLIGGSLPGEDSFFKKNRPMEVNPRSGLGMIESLFVGLIRAPILLSALVSRIYDLIQEENIALASEDSLTSYKNNPLNQDGDFSRPWWEDDL